MAAGVAAFQLVYMLAARPPRGAATRFILTQIAAHYIGSMILII